MDALLSLLIQDEAQYGGNLNGRYVVKDNYGAKIGPEGHKLLAAEKDEHIVVLLAASFSGTGCLQATCGHSGRLVCGEGIPAHGLRQTSAFGF